jgi:hypothetical protein
VSERFVDVQQTCTNTSYGLGIKKEQRKEFLFQYLAVIGEKFVCYKKNGS